MLSSTGEQKKHEKMLVDPSTTTLPLLHTTAHNRNRTKNELNNNPQAPLLQQKSDDKMLVEDGTTASMKKLGQTYFKVLADASDKWGALDTLKAKETTLDNTLFDLASLTAQISADFLLKPFPPLPDRAPPTFRINCSHSAYSTTLTGELDPSNKTIVDMVLFGWDIDLLEIRLLEYGDLVDKFLIVEQTSNLKGVPKPLLIPKLLEGRLAQFKDKIDYVVLNASHLDPITVRNDTWAVERHLRDSTGKYAKETYDSETFVIQNDGDEIISRLAMAHFKVCELRDPREEVRFPALAFKRNAAWLQKVTTVDFFRYTRARHELSKYLWAPGPSMHKLSILDPLHIREHPYVPCKHMGLGSANHFSEPSHPIYNFVKKFSTVDSTLQLNQGDFWRKAKEERLSYADIRGLNYRCQMNDVSKQHRWVGVTEFSRETQNLIKSHLPWALFSMGSRYTWLYYNQYNFLSEEKAVYSCVCKRDKRSCHLWKFVDV